MIRQFDKFLESNPRVTKISFIIQEVDDPDQLKAVSGALGLIGVVTAVTLKMDKMTYARFHPKKTLMADSIPKPGTDPSHPAFKRMVELCRFYF